MKQIFTFTERWASLIGYVSKMESQTDMYLSTIRKYIEAMGGELEIIAKFPEGSIKVYNFESLETP